MAPSEFKLVSSADHADHILKIPLVIINVISRPPED